MLPLLLFVWSCSEATPPDAPPPRSGPSPEAAATGAAATGTCSGTYPSYWQDPAFSATGMWHDELLINQPPQGWSGPVFALSDRYPKQPGPAEGGWRAHDPFREGLPREQRAAEAEAYIWALMRYIQEGNVGAASLADDWTLCDNTVRPWFHMPFQTYDPMSGREFVHGLTREAPVTFELGDAEAGGSSIDTTVWAVGFFNSVAGATLGSVWQADGQARMPEVGVEFSDGAVIGKLLFTTATPDELPFLENLPAWQANISAPDFCNCKPASGKECSYREMTEQCPRSIGQVTLMQFDVAVRDSRSPTGWAFGTFVADGQRKAGESNPWLRISPLGLMWTNDAPPVGQGAIDFPADPRANGFEGAVIFWDVVDMLNEGSNAGHLGCNSRLNGPADNARSSCLSCHQTASVPDQDNVTPPIFDLASNGQCVRPPNADVDAVYFANQSCGTPFQGGDVVPGPKYASGRRDWIPLDFSLQLSISLVQWQEWQQDQAASDREFEGRLPAR